LKYVQSAESILILQNRR